MRWINFGFDSTIPSVVAFAEPVGVLTAIGAIQLLVGVPALLVTVSLIRWQVPHTVRFRQIQSVGDEIEKEIARIQALAMDDPGKAQRIIDVGERLEAQRAELDAARDSLPRFNRLMPSLPYWVGRLVSGLLLLSLLVYGVVAVPFPGGWIQNIATFIAIERIFSLGFRTGRVPLGLLLWPILGLMLTSALVGGISPAAARPAMVTFQTDQTLANGDYLQLGQDDRFVYLRTCLDQRAPVNAIPISDIRRIEYSTSLPIPASQPTLEQAVRGVPIRFGFISSCH
jgi:hypothetical protein